MRPTSRTITKLHEQAIDNADLVLYSGQKLLAEADRGRERSYLLGQAVDFDHWSRVGAGELCQSPRQWRAFRDRGWDTLARLSRG